MKLNVQKAVLRFLGCARQLSQTVSRLRSVHCPPPAVSSPSLFPSLTNRCLLDRTRTDPEHARVAHMTAKVSANFQEFSRDYEVQEIIGQGYGARARRVYVHALVCVCVVCHSAVAQPESISLRCHLRLRLCRSCACVSDVRVRVRFHSHHHNAQIVWKCVQSTE